MKNCDFFEPKNFIPTAPEWLQFFLAMDNRTRLRLCFQMKKVVATAGRSYGTQGSRARGPPQFLKTPSKNAGANGNLSCGFPSIPGIAPGVAPRIVVSVLLKSWGAIPRMEFRIPRIEFRIPRGAPRTPRNSPRAPRMAFSPSPI